MISKQALRTLIAITTLGVSSFHQTCLSTTATFIQGWKPSEACALFSDKGWPMPPYAVINENNPNLHECRSTLIHLSPLSPEETLDEEQNRINTLEFYAQGIADKTNEMGLTVSINDIQKTEDAIIKLITYARELYFRATGKSLNLIIEVRVARGFDGTWIIGKKKRRKITFKRTSLEDNKGFILEFKLMAMKPKA